MAKDVEEQAATEEAELTAKADRLRQEIKYLEQEIEETRNNDRLDDRQKAARITAIEGQKAAVEKEIASTTREAGQAQKTFFERVEKRAARYREERKAGDKEKDRDRER